MRFPARQPILLILISLITIFCPFSYNDGKTNAQEDLNLNSKLDADESDPNPSNAMPWLFLLLSSDYCVDADGDGYYAQAGCGTAVDCDDNDSSIHPGADEICSDGIDNDCDGIVDELRCVELISTEIYLNPTASNTAVVPKIWDHRCHPQMLCFSF